MAGAPAIASEEVWGIAYEAAHACVRLCGGDPGEILLLRVGGEDLIAVLLRRVEAGEVRTELHIRRIVWQAARNHRHARLRAEAREARIRAALAGA